MDNNSCHKNLTFSPPKKHETSESSSNSEKTAEITLRLFLFRIHLGIPTHQLYTTIFSLICLLLTKPTKPPPLPPPLRKGPNLDACSQPNHFTCTPTFLDTKFVVFFKYCLLLSWIFLVEQPFFAHTIVLNSLLYILRARTCIE